MSFFVVGLCFIGIGYAAALAVFIRDTVNRRDRQLQRRLEEADLPASAWRIAEIERDMQEWSSRDLLRGKKGVRV